MQGNSSLTTTSSDYHMQLVSSDRVKRALSIALVQIFVWPSVYTNFLMFFAFSRKQVFQSETRYILFAQTVLVDLIFLLLTNFVVILSFNDALMPVAFCIPLCMMMEMVTNCTPLTITAMCVERYVAICMPLRHSAISTTSRTMILILVIWIISAIFPFMDVFILIATSSQEYLVELTYCHYEIMTPEHWHRHMRGIIYILSFVVIVLVDILCFVMISVAARAASGDNKKSASKGQRTLVLHLLQLLLCVIEIICPYIEVVLMDIDIELYLTIQIFDFLVFSILSRAVSPVAYGLRDEKFRAVLVYYAKCKMNHISETEKKIAAR
ncbi:odorant receptor 131-2-like [Chanos chanos]|uniref:Odorant receptor 131-2-like n=1 Tax=Chanos chanos TaxID=29144 RepID=A0A6J2VLT9_CHACN|nr:odorant receptor 131-2-like [Chanos chanos]